MLYARICSRSRMSMSMVSTICYYCIGKGNGGGIPSYIIDKRATYGVVVHPHKYAESTCKHIAAQARNIVTRMLCANMYKICIHR